MRSRIAAIDGLRSLAILLVIGFHYFSRHGFSGPTAAPADSVAALQNVYGGFPLFRYGYLGVMLFFAISGFVISYSLHGSNDLWSFAVRRFARLWPTMLLCCTATFLVFLVLPGPPKHPRNFLPSLSFVDPQLFNALLRTDRFHWMDDAYWSLFVEVRFYAIAAGMYFLSPRHFFRSMLLFSCCVGVAYALAVAGDVGWLRQPLNMFCIAGHLPWFTLGIGSFFAQSGQARRAAAMCGTSLLFVIADRLAYLRNPILPGYDATVCAVEAATGCGVLALLLGALRPGVVGDVLAVRAISAIGVASYSLYLLHGEIGGRLMAWMGNPLRLSPGWCAVYPVGVAIAFIICSQAIYRCWETPLNRLVVGWLTAPRTRSPG